MKYFVSIENTSYFYWQIELLIQSFKMHGLENDLIISIADNQIPKNNMYFKNLIKHKNLYSHENVGKERNYLPLNRIYSLEKMTREGILDYPFTLIHSDMVLKQPIQSEKYNSNIITNTYQIEEEEINEIINFEKLKKDMISKGIISSLDQFYYSHPIIFNHDEKTTNSFKENFFKFLIYEIELMILENKNNKSKNLNFEKATWKKVLLNSAGHCEISGDVLSCSVTDDIEAPFIHYNKGIPPAFSKLYFKYDNYKEPVFLAGVNDPFQQILNLRTVSANSSFLAEVVDSYKKDNF